MAEKPRHLLSSVPPSKVKAVLDDLNRLSLKHGLLGTTSTSCMVTHIFTEQDFDNTLTGALVRENSIQGAAARTEALGPRNIELAEIYRRRLKAVRAAGSQISESDLKAQIGKNVRGLERSAAIAAVNDGLQRLNQK